MKILKSGLLILVDGSIFFLILDHIAQQHPPRLPDILAAALIGTCIMLILALIGSAIFTEHK